MAPSTLSTLVALGSAGAAMAQVTLTFPATPLNHLTFAATTDLPYQIYPDTTPYVRGPQSGYNICNSTTEGDQSLCQTMVQNSIMGARLSRCWQHHRPSHAFPFQTSASGDRPRSTTSLMRRVRSLLTARSPATVLA